MFDILEIVFKIIVVLIILGIIGKMLEWIIEHIVTIGFVIVEIVTLFTGRYKISILVFVLYCLSIVFRMYIEWTFEVEDGLKQLEKERKDNQKRIKNWALEAKNISVNVDSAMISAVNNFKQNYIGYYDYTNMPYGRAVSFLTHFIPFSYDEDFYFFLPEKTENVYDMRENGLLIAKSGIYIIYEESSSGNNNVMHKECLVFRDCFSYDENKKTVKLVNDKRDGFKDFSLLQLFKGQKYSGLEMVITTVLAYKIPQLYNYLDMDCDDIVDFDTVEYRDDSYKRWAEIFAVMSSEKTRDTIYNELKNYMNGRQGAGYAAEYINNTFDRLFGKEVINEAQNLDPMGRQVKDGADRIVNGVFIQTKYHKNFFSLYHDCFPNGRVRYQILGKPMKVEVPRDKYVEYCRELQKKIDMGEIKGLPAGTKAEDILKKGWASYEQAQMVAKAGTIEGLFVDSVNGVMCSIPGATVSSVIVFAVSIWDGADVEAAFKSSAQAFTRVVVLGTGKYVADMQLKRLSGTELAKGLGLSDLMKNGISETAFSTVLIMGPDMFKFFSGKISSQQAVKNVTVAGAGALSGKVGAGTVGGLIGGPVGGAVGLIVGGLIGSFAAKTVLDEFIEDDSVKMFEIFKEEYLDCVTLSGLNKQELQELAEMTVLNSERQKILENMYSVEDSRGFARMLIEQCIIIILAERTKVTEAMLCEGLLHVLRRP